MKKKELTKGKEYWRSLDQLAETPEYKQFLEREFPEGASDCDNAWSRRKFITLMGASLAMAGLAGCRRPVEKIVPYVERPEEIVPGIPQHYATSMPFGDSAYGVLVESHEGRPTKMEGNKLHPSTGGASSAFIQAQILGLYDPDRSTTVLKNGKPKTWNDFVLTWIGLHEKFKKNGGEGLAVLGGAFSSPTTSRLRSVFQKTFPKAKWITHEPVSDRNIYDGLKVAYGQAVRPQYAFDKADVILSLDSDFLLLESDSVVNARRFANGRNVESEQDKMNRLYVVECGYSTTGANADHRQAVKSHEVGAFALSLAHELKNLGVNIPGVESQLVPQKKFKWVKEVARDLKRAGGRSIVVAGRRQPAAVHALVAALNEGLGNAGKTVLYTKPVDTTFSDRNGLKTLANDIKGGIVSTLVMIDSNPLYDAPADLEFATTLSKVSTTIQLSNYVDETSTSVTWHIPQAHFLESWGDARSYDGTVGIIQPLIQPLFDSVSDVEMVGLLAEGKFTKGYDAVRKTWEVILRGGNFETKWRRVLHDGLLSDSASELVSARLRGTAVANYLSDNSLVKNNQAGSLEIVFAASPAVYDGRFAGNGWLQELPHPVTKLTWDNAALLSQSTAKQINVKNNDIVKLDYRGRNLELPVWIQPGQAENCVIVELGYGRHGVSKISDAVGANAFGLKDSAAGDFDSGLVLTKTGRTHKLACTQNHWSMEDRPIVREATLEEYHEHPNFAKEAVKHPPLESMFNEPSYAEGYQWGMTVDLNSCVGCNACMVACNSENNIPVVGREQVIEGREMHWIRLDRYYTGNVEDPETVHQPVLCQHCENAPCEQVCPVGATVHDAEGLNTMVYNRCIGTRYCSNNCPYKVRRFNFFNYTSDYDELAKMAQNPDVTVRFRGVMEKCTYCVQRISSAKITAKKERRDVRDGEIIPACQQACPADALTFGNINDPGSEVSKRKKHSRNYDLLGELNVKPRTSYLAKLRNPNPEIKKA